MPSNNPGYIAKLQEASICEGLGDLRSAIVALVAAEQRTCDSGELAQLRLWRARLERQFSGVQCPAPPPWSDGGAVTDEQKEPPDD